MKVDDIVLLIKAGYTKADIEALTFSPDPQSPPAADPATLPDKPVSEPAPEAAQPEVKPAADDERFSKLETKLDYVINRFNYMAQRDSQQPAEHTESVDDILAKMIR